VTITNGSNAALRGYAGNSLSPIINATMGSSGLMQAMTVSRTYAAFPTPGTAWTNESMVATGSAHFVYFRLTS
jgi:hypothetical protein